MSVPSFDVLLASLQAGARPLSSLEEDDTRDLMVIADVIWGYDPQQDLMRLFYGDDLLREIARGRADEFDHLVLLCFLIDLSRDEDRELEKYVRQLRGNSCYRRTT